MKLPNAGILKGMKVPSWRYAFSMFATISVKLPNAGILKGMKVPSWRYAFSMFATIIT